MQRTVNNIFFPNKHLSWAVGGWRMLIGSCYQWGNSKRLQSRTVFQPSKERDILSGRWFPELQLICGTSGRTSAIRIRASSFSFVCQGFRLLTLYLNLIRGKGRKACFVYWVSWSGRNAGGKGRIREGDDIPPRAEGNPSTLSCSLTHH